MSKTLKHPHPLAGWHCSEPITDVKVWRAVRSIMHHKTRWSSVDTVQKYETGIWGNSIRGRSASTIIGYPPWHEKEYPEIFGARGGAVILTPPNADKSYDLDEHEDE